MSANTPSPDRSLGQILQDELSSRISKNPRYSLRSFARQLEVSASHLSSVMRGQQGLSSEKATELADRLGYSPQAKKLFIDLVQSQFARSEALKARARKRIESSRYRPSDLIDPDLFRVISDWYHVAILELTRVQGFEPTPAWIGARLGVCEDTIAEAIERLIKGDLLERTKTGQLKCREFRTTSNIPSAAVREFHHQIMDRAQVVLENTSSEERHFSEVVFATSRKQVEYASQRIREFRRELMKELEADPNPDGVYVLATQFFRLDK